MRFQHWVQWSAVKTVRGLSEVVLLLRCDWSKSTLGRALAKGELGRSSGKQKNKDLAKIWVVYGFPQHIKTRGLWMNELWPGYGMCQVNLNLGWRAGQQRSTLVRLRQSKRLPKSTVKRNSCLPHFSFPSASVCQTSVYAGKCSWHVLY